MQVINILIGLKLPLEMQVINILIGLKLLWELNMINRIKTAAIDANAKHDYQS